MPVYVNQVGYPAAGKKHATISGETSFRLMNESGECVLSSDNIPEIMLAYDESSGENTAIIDFSAVESEGCYYFETERGKSAVFSISGSVYDKTFRDSLKMFYYQRCGIDLVEKYAGRFSHKACHTRDVYELDDPRNVFSCCGGWHDAGDYGRYVTAGAVALGHLLYAYKLYDDQFQTEINIPESGNGIPDILNECRYELEWLLKMQREDGGVYHKCTSMTHTGFVMPEDDPLDFLVTPVSSMATADLAAVCALASGIYARFDIAFSKRLAEAAILAHEWLFDNPGFLYDNRSECTTGEYDDMCDIDERMWAAVELYCMTGDDKYLSRLGRFLEFRISSTALGWDDVGGFAALCILTAAEGVFDKKLISIMRSRWLDEADRLLKISVNNAFEVAMRPWDYKWGSNMVVLTAGDVLLFAYELTGSRDYLNAAVSQLDYILGRNACDVSYVTGNGERAYSHPHNRPSESDGIDEAIPGQVSGGPNSTPCDEPALELIPKGCAPMKCYVDHWGSYSTNEITIYWNSPLVFLLAGIIRNTV